MNYPIMPYQPKEPSYKKSVIIDKKEFYFGQEISISEIPDDTESMTVENYNSSSSSSSDDRILLVFYKQIELEEHEKESLRKEYEKMVPIYEKNIAIYKERKELYDNYLKEQRDKKRFE